MKMRAVTTEFGSGVPNRLASPEFLAKAWSNYERVCAERDELAKAATAASNVLAELYAKYSTKIGPFATQAQKANGMLRAALAKVSP